jgi:hypothetical protein
MRSFVTLIACIGCIAWVHSLDKRLLGVKPAGYTDEHQQQLPIDVIPQMATMAPIVPARQHILPQITTGITTARLHHKSSHTTKRIPIAHAVKDSLTANVAVLKHPGFLLTTLNP